MLKTEMEDKTFCKFKQNFWFMHLYEVIFLKFRSVIMKQPVDRFMR